jgi:TolA-binding protein
MKVIIQKVVAVFALSGMCLAQSAPSNSTTTTTTTKTHTKSHKSSSAPTSAESMRQTLREMKEMLQQQQQQTQQLQQQVTDLKQQMSQREAQLQQLQQAQSATADAQAKAVTAQTAATEQAQQAKAEAESVKQTLATTTTTIQQDQKKMAAIENPEKLHYKGITITPGGFLAAESIFRNHTQQNDVLSAFNGIAYDNDPRTKLTEFRASARQSRLSLLVEGRAGKAKLTGYYEADFLGAAPTANENQSSSFQPRARQLFAQAALDNGWTFTAGQTWSLISMNKVGIATRGEWLPATIDSQYVPGFNYARIYTARVTKTINKNVAVAVSAENHADLVTGSVPANVSGVPGGVLSAGAGALANGVNYSTAVMPDVIAKVAFDPGWGHYEVKGVMRVFRDHVLGTDTNQKKVGGGIGAGMILPLKKNKVDFYAETLYGNGTSRYNDSGNADLYIRPDGNIELVRATSFLTGVETHFTPKLDWYTYAGTEYQQRSAGVQAGTAYGYGSPSANYSKCYASESTFACGAPFKNLNQVATGFWYRFYKGSMGTLQYGMEYNYTQKIGWSGLNGGVGTTGVSPKGDLHGVYTSFRYYIP